MWNKNRDVLNFMAALLMLLFVNNVWSHDSSAVKPSQGSLLRRFARSWSSDSTPPRDKIIYPSSDDFSTMSWSTLDDEDDDQVQKTQSLPIVHLKPSQSRWHEDWKIVPYGPQENKLPGSPRELLKPRVNLVPADFNRRLQKGKVVVRVPQEEFENITHTDASAEIDEIKERLREHQSAIARGAELLQRSSEPYGALFYRGFDKVLGEEQAHILLQGRVRDALYAFYKIAENKNALFVEGTFLVEDKRYQLFDLLEAAGAYKRISSHYKGYGKELHSGLDLDEQPDRHKRHVLFGKLPNGLIFVKPEHAGLAKVQDIPVHMWEWGVAILRKIKWTRDYLNLGSDDQPLYRKERVPGEDMKEFEKALSSLKLDADTYQKHLNAAKHYGVRQMLPIMSSYAKNSKDPAAKLAAQEFVEFIHTLYDNPEIRQGREVIITKQDIENI